MVGRKSKTQSETEDKIATEKRHPMPYFEFIGSSGIDDGDFENFISRFQGSTGDMNAIAALVQGLTSRNQDTQKNIYTKLFLLFKFNNNIRVQEYLDILNTSLTTNGENTKGERTCVYSARVLGLGALVRGKSASELGDDALNNVLHQLTSLAQKKLSLLKLATPFICTILRSLTTAQCQKIDIQNLNDLLMEYQERHSSCILHMCLIAQLNAIELSPNMLNTMEDICTVVATDLKSDNTDCTELLFSYLKSSNRWNEFWSVFVGKVSQYDVEFFITCLRKSLEKGCSLKHLIRTDIIRTLLSAFRVKSIDIQQCAVSAFRLLLNWCPTSCTLNSTERNSALKTLFEEISNVLSEYKALHATLRQFTTYLSSDELNVLADICLTLLKNPNNSNDRVTNSVIAFLSRVAQARNISEVIRTEVAKYFFVDGFCQLKGTEDCDGNVNGEVKPPEMTEQVASVRTRFSREAFEAICRSVFSKPFFDGLFSFVELIIADKMEGIIKKVPAQDLAAFKKALKLSAKTQDENISTLLKVYAIFIIVDSEFGKTGVEALFKIHETKKNQSKLKMVHEIVCFILQAIREEKIVFNYEVLFTRFLIEGSVGEASLQELIDVVDLQTESMPELTDDYSFSAGGFTEHATQQELDVHSADDMDTDSLDLDMDEASEQDLRRMDMALSSVFSEKNKIKEELKLEHTFTIRVLNLMEMLVKRSKIPEATIPLMMLPPSISVLIKAVKTKNVELQSRSIRLLRKLNSLKKVKGGENVESALVKQVCDDIVGMLDKKLPKIVRTLIRDSSVMLNKCYKPANEEESRNGEAGKCTETPGIEKLSRKRKAPPVGNILASV